tara:strand:- start:72 stop:275 length:204 start_codon:yes stop_codon:yes gene_type:complete
MHPTDEGLTVGELTIAISALIILFLVWSGFTGKGNQKNSLLHHSHYVVMNSSELASQENAFTSQIPY